MVSEFTLRIQLGNAAVQTPGDIADLLRKVASRLDAGQEDGKILDLNGSSVGEFSGDFEEEDEGEAEDEDEGEEEDDEESGPVGLVGMFGEDFDGRQSDEEAAEDADPQDEDAS